MVGTERGGATATAPLERRDEVAACDRETMKRVRGRTGGRDPVATGKGAGGRRGRAGEKSVSFSFFRLSLPLLRHLFFFLLRRLYSQQLGISRATLDIVFAASRVSFSLEILSARRRACIPILRLSSFFPFLSGRASAALRLHQRGIENRATTKLPPPGPPRVSLFQRAGYFPIIYSFTFSTDVGCLAC